MLGICQRKSPGPQEELNVSAFDLCLRNNFFKFNEKLYQQRGEVGTGIKLAPTYACLGMERILLCKRFIDDVFLLFKGTKEECGVIC